jgi:hypothetical protein
MEWGWLRGPVEEPAEDWGDIPMSRGQSSGQWGETKVARMGGSRYTVILRANENVPLVWNFIIQTFFLWRSRITTWRYRITTSDSVENAYLLHSDAILQIEARWITSQVDLHEYEAVPIVFSNVIISRLARKSKTRFVSMYQSYLLLLLSTRLRNCN